MNYKAKRTVAILFILVTMVLASFAANSLAKYVFSSSEQLKGMYTDFRLSHDGDNKSVILEEVTSGDYTHVGHVTINLRNEDSNGELSQRNILFNIVPASEEQINAGKIVDSWGEETELLKDEDQLGNFVGYFSDYYDLTVIDTDGDPMDSADANGKPVKDSNLYKQNFLLAEPENPNAPPKTTKIMLKVQRRKTRRTNPSVAVPDLSTNSVESLDLVLKTFIPYIDLKVLQLNLTSSLVYVSHMVDDYFTKETLIVNVKTSINYSVKVLETVNKEEKTNTYSSYLPVKMVFTFDSTKLLFDYERFRLSVEDNFKELSNSEIDSYSIGYHYQNNASGVDTLTLFVPAASDIDLHFYIMGNSGCAINLTNTTFKLSANKADGTNTYNYLSEVSGLTSTGNSRLVYTN